MSKFEVKNFVFLSESKMYLDLGFLIFLSKIEFQEFCFLAILGACVATSKFGTPKNYY